LIVAACCASEVLLLKTSLNAQAVKGSGAHRLGWLMNLGGVGLFGLAVIDSSVIPVSLPGSTDLVLLLLTVFRSKSILSPVIFGSCAFAGSLTGGYMTWATGKKGGEAALEKLGKGRLVRRVQGWVKRNGVVSVAIAALLPPPVPLMPFLFAAGAMGLSRIRFFIAYGGGRALRYGAVAWLGYRYGQAVLVIWQKNLKGWTTPIMIAYFALLIFGTAYGVWKYRRGSRKTQ
jgi:membrane protein DedA with SNARE-associated domain